MPYNVQYNASDIAIDPDTAEMLFEEYDPRKIVGNDGGLAITSVCPTAKESTCECH